MQAHVHHRGVRLKGVLRAVSVVHIPVENQDFVHSMLLLEMACSDRNIVEQAKAKRRRSFRVVTGRPAEPKGVVDRSVGHRINH